MKTHQLLNPVVDLKNGLSVHFKHGFISVPLKKIYFCKGVVIGVGYTGKK